jgi:hypothetical protein
MREKYNKLDALYTRLRREMDTQRSGGGIMLGASWEMCAVLGPAYPSPQTLL